MARLPSRMEKIFKHKEGEGHEGSRSFFGFIGGKEVADTWEDKYWLTE
jgi:hypothetical protein